MKRVMLGLSAMAFATTLIIGQTASAGMIERACVKSDRKAANRSTCNCVQKVANVKLSRSDQKLAAKFFKDPHMAQEVRQSDRASHETFWLRYKEFGEVAARHCSTS